MTIPGFDVNGNLPAGIHRATLREIGERLTWNGRRKRLLRGYGVDFLISTMMLIDAKGRNVLDFFQLDRNGNRKGILLVEIGE